MDIVVLKVSTMSCSRTDPGALVTWCRSMCSVTERRHNFRCMRGMSGLPLRSQAGTGLADQHAPLLESSPGLRKVQRGSDTRQRLPLHRGPGGDSAGSCRAAQGAAHHRGCCSCCSASGGWTGEVGSHASPGVGEEEGGQDLRVFHNKSELVGGGAGPWKGPAATLHCGLYTHTRIRVERGRAVSGAVVCVGRGMQS